MQKKSKKYAKGGIMSYLSPAYAASQDGPENVLAAFSPVYALFKAANKKEKVPEPVNMTKSKEFDIGTSFNTTGNFKKGGKVKGCGAALRGYGKAMKGSK